MFLVWVLLLVWNFCVSVWDSYAAGYNLKLLENETGALNIILRIGSFSALVIGFVGSTYIFVSVAGIIAYLTNYLSDAALLLLFDLTFVVGGAVLVFFGIIVTIESVVLAAKTHESMSIFASIYNTMASIWNTSLYIREAPAAIAQIGSEFSSHERDNELAIIVLIVIVSVIASMIVSYLAFKAGVRRASIMLQGL